ncbi:anti-sigma factor domain-containing protein [Chitinophaga sp. Ak27]|uniref:anti-sigma factor n=1 Tax=Chitinophaga sp. Ak27 TaxID=2726116 RepID=UPI00145E93C1|nr:anti-sigma factor [Chitinophaga sp. Ak27]NLU90318.1 anti-sigma factor [Chitinophaga sp. Ak27]
MDIKAYIESGVIESYVLGMADAEEVAELQRLRLEYPAIAAAIKEREQWLREFSEATGRPAPGALKDQLLQSLNKEFAVTSQPVHFINRRLKFIAAALLLALFASTAGNVYLYKKYTKATGDFISLQKDQIQVLAENQAYQARLITFDHELKVLSEPGVIKIPLTGVTGKEGSLATVYWDTESKDVYLMVNNLPPTPSGKQYQLWALIDGKPVDAGIISNCASFLCHQKQVTGAQTFAITLEKTGGSPTPTLDQMFVIGNVKS